MVSVLVSSILTVVCNLLPPTKLILGMVTFLTADAELTAEWLLVNVLLTPVTPLLTMLIGFRYEGLELGAAEEEAATHVLVLELLMVDVVVLLDAAVVVEEDVCVSILGSVDGIGFPSLVWSFTTYRQEI